MVRSMGQRMLRAWLQSSPVTHEALAKRIGVSRSAVTHYVSGRMQPRVKVMFRIERETGVPVEAWTKR